MKTLPDKFKKKLGETIDNVKDHDSLIVMRNNKATLIPFRSHKDDEGVCHNILVNRVIPYKACLTKDYLNIYEWVDVDPGSEKNYNKYNLVVKLENYKKVHLGNPLSKKKLNTQKTWIWKTGTNILVESFINLYYYIGHNMVLQFKTKDNIYEFYAPIIREVEYPFALGINFAYIFIDNKVKKIPIKELKKRKENVLFHRKLNIMDPYEYYYKLSETMKKKIKNVSSKILHKRKKLK